MRDAVSLALGFAGAAITITKGKLAISNLRGALLALASATICSTYWILNLKDKREDIEKMLLKYIL